MRGRRVGRRKFLSGIAQSTAALSVLPRAAEGFTLPQRATPKIKIGVIGINHSHIYGQELDHDHFS
jgi:hypothetical protein